MVISFYLNQLKGVYMILDTLTYSVMTVALALSFVVIYLTHSQQGLQDKQGKE